MEQMFLEIAKQVPSALIIYLVIMLFLKDNKERELQRSVDAKDRSDKDRAHQVELARMNGSYITELIKNVNTSSERIALALEAHEKASQERYERMGITKDIIKKLQESNEDTLPLPRKK